MSRVVFLWPGFPDYAARALRELRLRSDLAVEVIATKPTVPVSGMETSFGKPVHWITEQASDEHLQLAKNVSPSVVFVGGTFQSSIKHLASYFASQGVPLVLMSDNSPPESALKALADQLRHRYFLSRRFTEVFVPGEVARSYMLRLGYHPEKVSTGLYGADPILFSEGPETQSRRKRILFVGQFIERKNVLRLATAFNSFYMRNHEDWELVMCGSGPLRDQLLKLSIPGMKVVDFLQPKALANQYHSSRFMILPSIRDHWPLVVHEASLSGCALLLSDGVGNAAEFAHNTNSIVFDRFSTKGVMDALLRASEWDDDALCSAGSVSRSLALKFGPARFAQSAVAAVNRVLATS